ncbi:MAG TPA: hypothetical protein VJR22_06560 [Candidatus Nitrosotalea sp.]|nr:hypothetical protein [Candidatus Nitrosotalea sp.]
MNDVRMLVGDEFADYGHSLDRKSRQVAKTKDGSVTDLIPTLFDMTKAMMKIRCNLDEADANDEMLEEFSKIESAIMKMTNQIEYLKRIGH